VSGRGQCTCEAIVATSMLRLIHKGRDLGTLGENVTTLDLKTRKGVPVPRTMECMRGV
jgi:hypothetical protein